MRLVALMGIPSIFVFTHDSIGLGEDGPTHQPIEQLAHLRAMPNMTSSGPADANETALAWQFALNAPGRRRPRWRSRARACRRSDAADVPDDAIERGAYVLRNNERRARRDPDRHRHRGARSPATRSRHARGARASRRGSCRCRAWRHFLEQDEAYRDDVLPPAVRARVAVEAAQPARLGPLVGDDGRVVGMDDASAPRRPQKDALRALRLHGRARRRSRQGSRRKERGMSVAAEVNERLARITELGTSIWLDQIRLNLIESGELERLVEVRVAARRHVEPGDLREGDPRLGRLRRADRGGRREGPRRARDLRARRGQDRAGRLRRAAARLRRVGRRRRLRLDRGRARHRVRHRQDDRVGAPLLGGRRPPERDGQDPGHRRGRAGDRGVPLRGHQHQRHAAVLGRGLRAGGRGLHQGARAPPGRGQGHRRRSRSRSFFVSRVDTEVDKRLEAIGNTELQGTAAVANARAAYQRFKEIFSGERWQRLAAAGAHVQRPLWASTGTKNPAYPETKYVDTLVGPHTVNTMPMADAERGRRAERGRAAPRSTRTRPPSSTRCARPASTWTT